MVLFRLVADVLGNRCHAWVVAESFKEEESLKRVGGGLAIR